MKNQTLTSCLLLALSPILPIACADESLELQSTQRAEQISHEDRWGPDSCEPDIQGDSAAGGQVREAFGIATYQYQLSSGEALSVRWLDDRDQEIGHVTLNNIEGPDGVADGRNLWLHGEAPNLPPVDIRTEIGVDDTYTFSISFEMDDMFVRASILYDEEHDTDVAFYMARVDPNAPRPGQGERVNVDDETYDILRVWQAGEALEGDAILTWADQVGVRPLLDSPLRRRMGITLHDYTWMRTLSTHATFCGLDPQDEEGMRTVQQKLECDPLLNSPIDANFTIDIATCAIALIPPTPDDLLWCLPAAFAAARLAGYWVYIALDPDIDVLPPFGSIWGDPHITTMDGLPYDLQGHGEFIALQTIAGDPITIQTRFEPMTSGPCANSATVMTAAAIDVHGTTLVWSQPELGSHTETILLDGQPIELPHVHRNLPAGGRLHYRQGQLTITWEGGERAILSGNNIRMYLPDHRRGQVRGLLGNFNGQRSDDIAYPSGRPLSQPISHEALYRQFAQSWRVTQDESLFVYGEGESTETYTDLEFPLRPFTIDDLAPELREEALMTCLEREIEEGPVLDGCTLDVACSSDPSLAGFPAGLPPVTNSDDEDEVEFILPVFLDGWTHEGLLEDGDWQIDPQGRSVTQSNDDGPTLFVSPREYLDATIQGTITVTGDGRDGVVGFLLGYQSPVAENDDAPNELHTYLVSWKGQDSDGGQEGLTFARVDGFYDREPLLGSLWTQEPIDESFTPIDGVYGSNQGWVHGRTHHFTISYGRERVVISLDGRVVLTVTSEQAGVERFSPGRLGFYNQSQPGATFTDVTIVHRAESVYPESFDYRDFATASELVTFDQARREHGRMHVSRAQRFGTKDTGGFWYPAQVSVEDGFETEFTFHYPDTTPDNVEDGGYGMAFVVHTDPQGLTTQPDSGAWRLGWSGMRNAVAVEFAQVGDARPGGEDSFAGPHVGIHGRWDFLTNNSERRRGDPETDQVPNFKDGQLHHALVRYVPNELHPELGRLSVYVDNFETPVLETDMDLAFRIPLEDGRAFVGFTASSDSATNHDLIRWSFTSIH